MIFLKKKSKVSLLSVDDIFRNPLKSEIILSRDFDDFLTVSIFSDSSLFSLLKPFAVLLLERSLFSFLEPFANHFLLTLH